MKNHPSFRTVVMAFACCQLTLWASAQRPAVKLATGIQQLDISSSGTAVKNIREKGAFNGRYYFIAKFDRLPAASNDLKLHAKIAEHTYLVSSAALPDAAFTKKNLVSQTATVDPAVKISSLLLQGRAATLPQSGGKIPLVAAVFPGISIEDIKSTLVADGFSIESTLLEKNNILSVEASPKQVEKLAAYPFIAFIQPQARDRVLNEKTRFMSGAFGLNASLLNGGYNLKGAGVVVGVGDDADPGFHPDLTDRIINRTPGIVNNHGAHVTGTIAGGGLLQPDRRGFAPLATVVSQFFNGIWVNAARYVQDFGMVLTNNSYGGQEGNCDYNGIYDLYAQVLDEQASTLPHLLHVFAAGNSGDDMCNPLPVHYGTVLGSYQSAKNVITVGRTDYPQLASGSSSSGPVKDGRLKPEITALGIVESCDGFSGYWGAYGTSMSAPGITGGLTLLYERYRQLHGGNDPDGALMKAVLLDGARDVGTPGPDYRHGYGFINLSNSIRILNNRQYFSGSLAQNAVKDSVITVAAGTALLKVMLYWHDLPASPLAAKTLVNDLDLEVVRPDGSTVVYPRILDPSNPAAPATGGADHRNNSEQVVIEAPLPGNYTIRVKGYEVQGSAVQDFYAAFDAVPAALILRTPVRGDNWSVSAPDEFGVTGVVISWDDEGTGSGSYKLEYSLDNGAGWTTITDALKDTCRYFGWRPPAGTATNTAMVRISKNNTSFTSTSAAFTIIDRPNYTIAANPCEGYITVNWTAVTGADDYEVIMKKGPEMVPVAVVAPPALTYTIGGLSRDSVYYVAVRARKAGVAGRWIKADGRQPNSGSCAGTISDGDLQLDSIVSPVYGREFTSNALGNNESVKIRIKNLDNTAIAAGSYQVKLSVDGNAFVSQPGSGAVAASGTYLQTFTGIDLSAKGNHKLTAVVENTGLADKVPANDTFSITVKNLPNSPLVLTAPFADDFETAPAFTLAGTTHGLPGLDRWDYFNSDPFARARSFVNTGIAKSGEKAITLDVSKAVPYVKNPANNLQGTFNLSGYSVDDDIRLDFQFKQHGQAQLPNAQNKVWVRGSDTQSWIEVYDLSANQPEVAGIWKQSPSLELSDLFTAAIPAQQFGSSMQVRFGQYAQYGMADNTNLAGYSFDDIRLYIAVNDMQMLSVDTPAIYSCGLNSSVPVRVTVRNSTLHPIANIPVSYTVNGGAAINEVIPVSIPANGSYTYQFSTPANLSDGRIFTIEASVDLPGDNVPDNNTTSVVINSQPVISSFPYLEDFEAGNGNYFVTGVNTSWQWGKPVSTKIDTAASGTRAWKTRLAGNYNDQELSQLNSPCFNISSLQNPMLSFSMAYDIEDCTPYNVTCDQAWVEYSADGSNWQKLGAAGQGTNWYDNAASKVWLKRDKTYWHVASIPLPKGLANLRLRFVFSSDEATNYEGIAIDDIHIYDLPAPMYNRAGTGNAITQVVSGNAPVNFSDGGKLVATILPNNNNLGSTEVKAYIYQGGVRNDGQQYYGNRNITIKPANAISGNATVRFYFTDKEADSLRLAATCGNCTNPVDYTHIGITQYTDADKQMEDGDLSNNNNGISRFISGSGLRLVPFDSGYYAEYNVSSFSEFWLNDGKGANQPLPGRWLSFDAVKLAGTVVKLTWSTANETGIKNYEVQVANSSDDVSNNNFTTIGETPAKNTSTAAYVYLDQRAGKSGSYYYRIRQADSNGRVFYSPVILVHFPAGNFDVKLYPNPVKDNLLVSVEAVEARQMVLVIFNMAGQQLYTQGWTAVAGVSQQQVNMQRAGLAAGVYTVAISDGKSWWYNKVVKE